MNYRENIRFECNQFVKDKNARSTKANKKKFLKLARCHVMAITGKKVV